MLNGLIINKYNFKMIIYIGLGYFLLIFILLTIFGGFDQIIGHPLKQNPASAKSSFQKPNFNNNKAFFNFINERINGIEDKITESIDESQKFTSLVITSIGIFFTIINILLSIYIGLFFYKSNKMFEKLNLEYQKAQAINNEINTTYQQNKDLIKKNHFIQTELSRIIWRQKENFKAKFDDNIPKEIVNSINQFLEYLNRIDIYRWGVLNCLSSQEELRIKAIHAIAININNFDMAKEFLLKLRKYYQQEKCFKEENTILAALGL